MNDTPSENVAPTPPAVLPAAQYIRMSTEHQQYSTENQAKAITVYAQQRGYEIVKTYADGGKSGLTFEGRQSLRQLIQDVQDGKTPFKHVLVYDISRWGRFQDADESAYYEFICKRAGIDIHYCAEQFENDGSTQATIFKSVKRAMAGEYSRKLSNDVFLGQCNLIEHGYRQGGMAGFGLRRMLNGKVTPLQVGRGLWGLVGGGSTNITAGIDAANGILDKAPKADQAGIAYLRPVVIAFTDGGHNEGPAPHDAANRLKAIADLVTVAFGDAADEALMRDLASTPQHFYRCSSGRELRQFLAAVGATMTATMAAGANATGALATIRQ